MILNGVKALFMAALCNRGAIIFLPCSFFLHHLVPRPSVYVCGKFYGDCPRGITLAGGLNATEVAKYTDFGSIKDYISETVQDRR